MSTYSPIASQTLSATATSITFNSVPQGYTDLVVVIKGQGTSNIGIYTRFNNDSAANYSRAYFYGDGSGQASGRVQNETNLSFSFNAARGHTIFNINGYSNSTTWKNALISNDYYDNGVVRTTGVWRNTAPITSITFTVDSSTMASGTVISLYGLAGGQVSTKATGGIVTTDATYAYHTFLTSGGFIPSQDLTSVDYLVVAGGGGGGRENYQAGTGGGGGAGGLRTTTSTSGFSGGGGSLETPLSLKAGITYPAVVGAGGAGYTTAIGGGPGYNGGDSLFSNIVSFGGGGGGGGVQGISTGKLGGSGGGAGSNLNTTTYGLGTTNQGYRGGSGGGGTNNAPAGGGGGAGAVGGNAVAAVGGAGGA